MPDFGIGEGFLLADLFGTAAATEGAADVGIGLGIGEAAATGLADAGLTEGAALGLGTGVLEASGTTAATTGSVLASGSSGIADLGIADIGLGTGLSSAAPAAASASGLPELATGSVFGTDVLPAASMPTELATGQTGFNIPGPTFNSGAPLGTTGVATTTGSGLVDGIAGPAASGSGTAFASGSDALSSLGTGITKGLTSNPLGLLASGAGLLMSSKPNQPGPNQANLQYGAGLLGQRGQALESYLTSGTLPQGLQSGIDQSAAAAKARIIQNHAAQGLPTDPSQNSALAQELNSVDLQVTQQVAQIGEKLFASGMQDTQLSADIYKQLATYDRQDQAALSAAIANFAKALSPSNSLTLKTA